MRSDRSPDAFDRRAATYSAERIRRFNEANERYPNARETERDILLDLLELGPGLRICDVAAGGGYLADGIYQRLGGACRIVCLENSMHFCQSLPERYDRLLSSLSDIALPDRSVDRVACLAGIHHQQDKPRFFAESRRILVPGGRIAVGDVLIGTAPARFLNEAVDRWSDLGHDGMFLTPGELSVLLENAGFERVREHMREYTWDFPNLADLVWYCKTLFRMTRAGLDDVEAELRRYLRIDVDSAGARMHWSLAYATAACA